MSLDTVPFDSTYGAWQDGVPAGDQKERKLLNRIGTEFQRAKDYRAPWDTLFRTCWNFYIGRHWGARPKWKATPYENYVFSKTETILPLLTANRPTVHILPREPIYQEYAEHMQMLMRYLWDRLRMDGVVATATKNCLIFGKGFYYVYYDPDTGEICCESVDPTNIYVDRDATSIENARILIHVARMSVTEIVTRWPNSKGKFAVGAQTVEDQTIDKAPSPDTVIPYEVGFAYQDAAVTPGTTVRFERRDYDDFTDEDEMVQVLQVWIRDPSITMEKLLSPDGNVITDSQGNEIIAAKAKYPGGRLVIVAGNRVIEDMPNPYDHGRFPYVEQNCYTIPGEFWCMSLVQNLISPQRELNRTLAHIIDHQNIMGHGIWVADKGSGVTPEMITPKPGILIEKASRTEVRREDAPPLPAYIPQLLQHIRQAIDDISGIHQSFEGKKATNITAGVAITSLQEATFQRQAYLVRNLEDAIQQVGELILALAQQFYIEGKMVRVTNRETGEFKFISLTPDVIQSNWELVVAPGSTLPRNREARQAQAMELLKFKVFGPEDAIDWIDHPQADKIKEKIRKRQQMQYDMAMQGVDVEKAMAGGNGVMQ